MSSYNPKIHNRKSLRLKGYDYTKPGLYFVTICCQDNAHRFEHVKNGEMILNDVGKMVEKWYFELESKYPDKRCHEMVVMPNHFHCIIENLDTKYWDAHRSDVVHRDAHGSDMEHRDAHIGTSLRGRPGDVETGDEPKNKQYGMDNVQLDSPLGNAVGWFKSMTTNAYINGVKQLGWPRFNGRLWQRYYYEIIIRNERAYFNISEYIKNNPAKWNIDNFNSK